MDTYANTLLIAIPIFFISVLLEALYGNWIKDQKHNFMDTISSLSSGITNLSWDVLGIAFFLFTYENVYQYIMIFNIELDSLTTSNQVSLYIVALATFCHQCPLLRLLPFQHHPPQYLYKLAGRNRQITASPGIHEDSFRLHLRKLPFLRFSSNTIK